MTQNEAICSSPVDSVSLRDTTRLSIVQIALQISLISGDNTSVPLLRIRYFRFMRSMDKTLLA